ncbi:hypothetical protein HMPREF9622_00153 [Cutibacterium modestum HL037PA3]|uniref:Uncharacterized protein n=1 Tax=Cutibacterium modestum HL044PA1 TaxID=765109 RepID=A0ABN0C2P9_9ACTN|nr:hypothetical protein HMPREF9621_00132 [Cutibacterium modestum HL037PA2]EFS91375.1 hypothetical protein HMPREF9607_02668 [Cutibacterium modestum HL044PA1]EFT16611.1 hypothetical protein HMPREF9622_00153 [Cutibacterium modestum HL037PA3]
MHEDKRADDDEPAQHCPQPEIPRRHARLHASSILFAPNTPTDLVHPDVHGNSNSQRRDHQGDEPEIHRTSAVPPRCDDIEVLAGPGQHPGVIDAEGDYPQQNVLEQGPVGVKSAPSETPERKAAGHCAGHMTAGFGATADHRPARPGQNTAVTRAKPRRAAEKHWTQDWMTRDSLLFGENGTWTSLMPRIRLPYRSDRKSLVHSSHCT